MKIYVKGYKGIPISDLAFNAYLGAHHKGLQVLVYDDIMEVPAVPSNLVVGDIDDTIAFFGRLGVKTPGPIDIPDDIANYLDRKVTKMKLGDFLATNNIYPVFIKCADKIKGIMAGVMQRPSSLDFYKDEDPEMNIWVSEYVDIVAEYRGFVINGELKALHNYGDGFFYYPDVELIHTAVRRYKSAPVGYTIDFGVTSEGGTVLIECNDGWAIGPYGCDPDIYLTLLMKRWRQIMTENGLDID